MEQKFRDNFFQGAIATDLATAMADPGPNSRPLNGLVEGTSQSQRIGRCSYVSSIHVHGHVQFPAEVFGGPGGGTTSKARLILVVDKQANAAQMSAVDYLANVTGTLYDTEAFANLQNSDRFMLIRDVSIDEGSKGLTTNNVSGGGIEYVSQATLKSFKINHYFKTPLKVFHQTGGTDTFSSIRRNQIHLIAIAHKAAVILTYNARVRFYDP
jgi:hypothetical protein